MKTAISIPEKVFRAAEQLRKGLGLSRSEFYARALQKYVQEHDQSWITAKLNELYGDRRLDNTLPPELEEMQLESLRDAEAGLKRRREAG